MGESDKEFLEVEACIENIWGVSKNDLDGIQTKTPFFKPFIPKYRYPPLIGSYKLNFDDASRGNPDPTKYGSVCSDATREILKVCHGSTISKQKNQLSLKAFYRASF